VREITPDNRPPESRLEAYVALLMVAIVMTFCIGLQSAKRLKLEQEHRAHPAHSKRVR
jgi:hypothetical protein